MTAPDTKAIRAQMEALTGFTVGPWRDEDGVIQSQTTVWQNGVKQVGWDYATIRAEVTDDWDQAANARLIAAAPDMHATILALCDALDTEQSNVRRMGREVNHAKYGQPDFAWGIHLEAMAELKAENERLRAALRNMTDFALGKMDDPSRADEMRLFIEARTTLAAMETNHDRT